MIRLSKTEAAKLGIKSKSHDKPKQGRADVSKEDAQTYIELTIPIKPQSKHRPRSFVDEKSIASAFKAARGDVKKFMSMIKTRTVTTKKTREFEKQVAHIASTLMLGRAPLDEPCALYIEFHIPGADTQWPVSIRDGDLDNHEKALLDALNNILYTDDRLIVKKESIKKCTSGDPKIYLRCIKNP